MQKIEINAQTALELGYHEAILLQAYKDSRKVWTWSVGITSASGHNVERYIDNPSTLDEALEVWVWLMKEKYAPAVLKAFEGYDLTQDQFDAALSFHWNTGKIKTASWVGLVKAGKMKEAEDAFMWYDQPKEIIPRRKAEKNLFFHGIRAGDGKISLIQRVSKSYQPIYSSAKRIDITAQLNKLLGDEPVTTPVLTTTSPVAEAPQVATPVKQSYNPSSIWLRLNLWLIKIFG